MNYLSKSYVYVTFYGENFVPTHFTNLIKIKPSRMGLKGKKGEYGSILQNSFWEYRIQETNALQELENSLENIIELFEDKIELIQTYFFENKLQSKCFVVTKIKNNEDTGVVLNTKLINFLHRLNMTLEICNYIDEEAR